MFGAIVGDIVGSVYEFNNIKTKDFPLFGEKMRFYGRHGDDRRRGQRPAHLQG
jgi:ADP-ribosylglycohydrolase